MKAWKKAAAVLCLAGLAMAASAQNTYTLPFVLAADSAGVTSFLRIINTTEESGTVQIHAIDDTGERFGPVTLSVGAEAVVNFTSRELEQGNAAKGLPSGVGDGSGNWRLEFMSALAIEPLAYIRTSDGFVTSMHDVAAVSGLGLDHWVPFFNPGSNFRQVSRLRLLNPGTSEAEVTITGRDDAGEAGGAVRLTLPAGTSRFVSAQALEAGGGGLDGSLGDGAGKWRLSVTASAMIQVMSLLSTPTGHVTNLSTSPLHTGGTPPPPPPECDTRTAACVVQVPSTTLGEIDPRGDVDWFRFTLPRAGRLQVQTTGGTDTVGRLFRGSNTTPTSRNDDSGVGNNFRITVPNAQAGTWYVEVTGFGNNRTGSYSLQVEVLSPEDDDHGNTPDTATVVQVQAPSTTAGRFERVGDVDYFRFTLPRAGRLQVQTTGSTDTVGRLHRSGSEGFTNDDSGTGLNFRITVPNAQAGTWYVRVSEFLNNQTGSYSLQVAYSGNLPDDHGNTRDTATVVQVPSTTAGRIEPPNDPDWFRFTLPRAGRLQVQTTGSTDTYGRLYRGSSTTPTRSNDDSGTGLNFRMTVSEAQAGTWYVEVTEYGQNATGPYSLQVEHSDSGGGTRYGAIATGWGSGGCSWAAGHALNRGSAAAAQRDAIEHCTRHAASLRNPGACSVRAVFARCGAVALGRARLTTEDSCKLSGGVENTRSAAEQRAVNMCRQIDPSGVQYTGCAIAVASGTRLSFCNTGVSASQDASEWASSTSSKTVLGASSK